MVAGASVAVSVAKSLSLSLSLSLHSLSLHLVLRVVVTELSDGTTPDASFEQEFEDADISIPGEVVGGGKQQVRMASFLFRNVSGLLPGSLNGTTSDDDG